MFEITTFWNEDVLAIAHAERLRGARELGIPWDAPLALGWNDVGPLRIFARTVDAPPPFPRARAYSDVAFAMTVALALHVAMFGLGMWTYRIAPPIDDAETLRAWMSKDRYVLGSSYATADRIADKAEEQSSTPSESNVADSNDPIARISDGSTNGSFEARDALADAADFGLIGLLRSTETGSAIEWGTPVARGGGGIFADDPGDGYVPSLSLSGVGEGGGGRGEGIGLGSIGGCHGCANSSYAWGHARAPKLGEHKATVVCHLPVVTVTCGNQLYVDTIRRIVRANMGRFRACYETGLLHDPSLQGRVAVKFVIDPNGSVSTAVDDNSTLPDKSVTQCIVHAFKTLEFPEHGGIGYVTYPLQLTPTQ